MVVAEAALSYLGLGVQPPTASWGSMLADGRNYLYTSWWLSTFPGIAIFLTVLSINVLGASLRERMDPRLRRGARVRIGPSGARFRGVGHRAHNPKVAGSNPAPTTTKIGKGLLRWEETLNVLQQFGQLRPGGESRP